MDYCFASKASDLIDLTQKQWLTEMKRNYFYMTGKQASELQVKAWTDCFEKSQSLFKQCAFYPCYIIFEYQMPRQGGRRPDILLLTGDKLFVLEYKMKDSFTQADIDQVSAYARDLQYYHETSHQFEVIPLLIPTKARNKRRRYNDVIACTPDLLVEFIKPYLGKELVYSLKEWVAGNYVPLPSLIDAAKLIYEAEDLPYIKKANNVGIPKATDTLIKMTNWSKQNHKRVLSLVTGVPGAGKTLLGLNFAYKVHNGVDKRAIFLSGNGPLVEVLQYALKSKSFVGPLHNFIKTYGIDRRQAPYENIIIFDEAQRAWDKKRVLERHSVKKSEPELMIQIAESIPHWSVVLGLVGEGQEIHIGEEAGIVQWRDALKIAKEDWVVVCPPALKQLFDDICPVYEVKRLNLNISLRSHIADDVSKFVEALLQNKLIKAKKLSKKIYEQKFYMYVTRDLERAKRYCVNRYKDEPLKRYGLIASSKSDILPKFGVDNTFVATSRMNVGAWYNEPKDHPLSSCTFNTVVTEFSCQGLELDMPIICWESDLRFEKGLIKKYNDRSRLKNPHQIRLNSYRVLLTRGRDGFIIYLPDYSMLQETYEALKTAGIMDL